MKLLQVYIEAEDYLRLKSHVSSSKGMSQFVRTLLRAYLDRVGAMADQRATALLENPDAAEHATDAGSARAAARTEG
jgi:hypothetical protein